MRNWKFATALIGASLAVLAAVVTAQHSGAPCKCTQDATYTDDPATTEPGCVQTFGISWTPTQDGICSEEGCPPGRPCEGELTVSVTGSCDWELDAHNSATGTDVHSSWTGSLSVPGGYSVPCANQYTFDWTANGVHLGTHKFKCKNCQGGFGH